MFYINYSEVILCYNIRQVINRMIHQHRHAQEFCTQCAEYFVGDTTYTKLNRWYQGEFRPKIIVKTYI